MVTIPSANLPQAEAAGEFLVATLPFVRGFVLHKSGTDTKSTFLARDDERHGLE